ncbi:hypothetical protein M408DRAFT_74226 [Serendipita vermifera MAFF 305830]|uniref:Uncharacterized protein n=1 Tax=Serendipita vermifera MAFF 305830 TaxID=933852 RepID=A0A0C3AZV6_SERVB|nr:hypothetical protein M408DRAFT_74226 [Serendipita vermifera MAFF 305830]
MAPPPNGLAPPYYGQPPLPHPDFHQPPQQVPPQPENRTQGPAFAYGPDGAMLDVHTGTPIFSMPKSAKVAIRRPGEADDAAANASREQPGSSRPTMSSDSNKEATPQENANQYRPQPHPDMTMPGQGFVQGHMQGHPGQQFWSGYHQAPNGYYYQQPMYSVPQPQEYMYAQAMQGQAPPMHGYPQPHYGDGMEYQAPVFY